MDRPSQYLGRVSVVAVLITIFGCEGTFDPKGTFEDRLVLFSLLSPSADSVQVRLQATFDPSTSDPLSASTGPDLTGATASLEWSGGQVTLRDTVVPHPDVARYPGGLTLLTASFRVVRGTTYTLRVDVPGYPDVRAVASVPGTASAYFRNEEVLRSPSATEGNDLGVVVGLAPEAYGYLPRLVVEYEIVTQGNRIEEREVPSALLTTANDVIPEYPRLQGTSTARTPGASTVEFFDYSADAYHYMLQRLYETYGQGNLRFRRAILTVTAVDRHLYTYYFLVNGFFDPNTVRTDRPDYSNVQGGAGVVGSFVVDSVVVSLPPSL